MEQNSGVQGFDGVVAMSGKRVISCLAVVCRDESEILLVRRLGSGRWTLPGGRLEPEESWRHCAARETAEETGVQLELAEGENDLVLHSKDKGGVRIYYFALWETHVGEAVNCEPHQHAEVAWHKLASLPVDMAPVMKCGIVSVLSGGGVIESGFPATKREQKQPKNDPLEDDESQMCRKISLSSRLFKYLFPDMK